MMSFGSLFVFSPGETVSSFLPQCFPEGTDMTAILDFYFQVHGA